MRVRTWFLTLAAVTLLAGCGGAASTSPGASSTTSSGRTPGPEDATYSFEIEEVGLGDAGYVALQNYTDVSSSLGALYLCQGNGCIDLPDVVVVPDGIARIAVGSGAGLEDVVLDGAALELTPADGEVGLYASENTDDSTAIRAYLQWGSTPHELTDVAHKAGVWRKAGYAPSAPHATRLWKTDANLWVWDPGS